MSHIGVVFYNQKVTPHWSSNTTFLVVWNSNSDLISNTVFLPRNHQNRQHMVLKGGWETKVGDGMGNIKFRKIIHKGGINIPENLAPLCPFPHKSNLDKKSSDGMILCSALVHSFISTSF